MVGRSRDNSVLGELRSLSKDVVGKGPKFVHLSSVHRALDTRIFYKQARTIAGAGHNVTLVAQHEQDEVREGVTFRALAQPQNRFERMLATSLRLLRLALKEKGDVYHFHDPELIPVGIVLRLLGKTVIYDVHEDVPKQVMEKEWIPASLRKVVAGLVTMFEWVGAAVFNRIVAATPAIARRFPNGKTVVVQNFPILGELVSPQAVAYGSRPPWIAYVGGITETRSIREMICALDLLPDDLEVCLRLAGRFNSPHLEREVRAMPGWKRVDFLGWQSRDQVAALLGSSRVGLVLFHPVPNHIEAQPNKLFEYMSAGIPVVASDFPLWRRIVEEAGCGLLANPTDPESIAEAIRYLLTHPVEAEEMGRRGQRAVLERYNWAIEARKLLALYKEVVHRTL